MLLSHDQTPDIPDDWTVSLRHKIVSREMVKAAVEFLTAQQADIFNVMKSLKTKDELRAAKSYRGAVNRTLWSICKAFETDTGSIAMLCTNHPSGNPYIAYEFIQGEPTFIRTTRRALDNEILDAPRISYKPPTKGGDVVVDYEFCANLAKTMRRKHIPVDHTSSMLAN